MGTVTTVVVKKNSANHFKAKEIKKAISLGKIPEEFQTTVAVLMTLKFWRWNIFLTAVTGTLSILREL